MPDIDKLQIEITASAKKADKVIANLEKNVKDLSSALGSIKTTNLNNLGSSINAISNANTDGLRKNISAVSRLVKATSGNINVGGITRLGGALSALQGSLASTQKVARSTTTLVSALARLSSSGAGVTVVASALPSISAGVKVFANSMSNAPVVSNETVQLVRSLGQLASAGSKADTTAKHLDNLGNRVVAFMQKLQNAPKLNSNITQLVSGLGQLASAGRSANGAFNSLAGGGAGGSKGGFLSGFGGLLGGIGGVVASGGTNPVAWVNLITQLGTSIKNLLPSLSSANSGFNGLAQSVGMFCAECWLVIRALSKVRQAVSTAMDYIETYNYFQAAWNQVGSKADLSGWRELGYKSAEEYANAVSNGLRKKSENMIKRLSGFTIGANGELSDTGAKSLGIDPDMAMQYQALYSQMGSSMGVASENANNLANALELISLDLASVKNMEFTDVLQDMSSGMTGMSRTVDKFGVNIRNAGMDAYLAEHGISATSKSLSQADKALLRTTIILDSSRYAWGDLAKTVNQPANQMRMLSNEMKSLGRTIGQILMPMVTKILPYLNALAIVARRAFEALGELLGVKFETGNNATPDNSAMSDYLDGVEDADAAQKKAAKSAKEWKNQLLGFDEVNKLQAPNDSSNDGGKGNTGANATSAISDLFNSVYDEYMKTWNKAYEGMEQKANELANRIKNAILNAWKNGKDFSSFGEALGTFIKNGLDSVDWNKVKGYTNDFATSLATFLNGFFGTKGLADSIGKTIAETINTAVSTINTFAKTVDWYGIGTFIYEGVSGFVNTLDLKTMGNAVSNLAIAFLDFINGAIAKIDFKELPKNIVTAISTFLGGANWGGLAQSSATLAKKLFEAVFGVKFGIDNVIADFIKNTNVGKLITEAIKKSFNSSSGGKTLSFTISLGISLAKSFNNAISKWKEFKKSGNVTKKIAITGEKTLNKIVSTWEKLKPKTVELKLKFDVVVADLKKWLNTNVIKKINSAFDKIKILSGVNIPEFKADGGVYANGKWQPIQKYAVGGMPNTGQMFIAREAGAELVGNLGGHTAVMNNDQIVSSVSSGVYEATSAAMANAVNVIVREMRNSNNTEIYMDSRKVTDAILAEAHRRNIATNTNVFMTV